MISVLRVLCLAVPALTVLMAGLLMVTNNTGGFLPNLARALALVVLAAGIVISWLLNAIYLSQTRGPRWLAVVTAVQTIPVLFVAQSAATRLLTQREQNALRDEATAVRTAIRANDVAAFEQARANCGELCLDYLHGYRGLLFVAADAGANRVTQRLLASVATYSPSRTSSGALDTFLTCENDVLNMSSALAAAVARNNTPMLDLLLPSAELDDRREAMWLAARLDRLAMVQRMQQAGVPITFRGAILDENATLVNAAAEGAAVRVARWLIEVHQMPVNAITSGPDPYAGVAPVRVLMSADREGEAPQRIASFLQLLVSHGANIDAPWDKESPTALAEMVRRRDRSGAELLLRAGAGKDRLTPDLQAVLTTLLSTPQPARGAHVNVPGCIHTGD